MALGFPKSRPTVSVIFVMICIISIGNKNSMANGQCKGDISGLISQCAKYVRKQGKQIAPSKQCCGVLKNVDIPCLCKYVTKDVEQYVNVPKAVYVAHFCGLPLHHGFKCGSYTIPGA